MPLRTNYATRHQENPTRTEKFRSDFFVFVKDENRKFGRSPAEHKQSSGRPAVRI